MTFLPLTETAAVLDEYGLNLMSAALLFGKFGYNVGLPKRNQIQFCLQKFVYKKGYCTLPENGVFNILDFNLSSSIFRKKDFVSNLNAHGNNIALGITCTCTSGNHGAFQHFALCFFRNQDPTFGPGDSFCPLDHDTIEEWHQAFQ